MRGKVSQATFKSSKNHSKNHSNKPSKVSASKNPNIRESHQRKFSAVKIKEQSNNQAKAKNFIEEPIDKPSDEKTENSKNVQPKDKKKAAIKRNKERRLKSTGELY